MKLYLLYLFLTLPGLLISAHSQTIDGTKISDIEGPYMQLVSRMKVFNPEYDILFDYGQDTNRYIIKGSKVRDENGDLIQFTSMVSALNFLHKFGYKLIEVIPKNDEAYLHYILYNDQKAHHNLRSERTDMSNRNVLRTGADQLEKYLPLLKGKKVGILGNQTSIVGNPDHHLVDVLIEEGVNVRFAFAPEHGFRGNIERGEKVSKDVDDKTGITLHSLYGPNEAAQSIVASADVMIYDLQDVGARFYTYITSLHRLMQLCADAGRPLIVLDRPNPNGDQVNGPVRKSDQFKSNVSYHKIAMVHGLTVGELAHMINGEGWLDGGVQCDLTVIPVDGYTHSTLYVPPVIPSPSLPNYLSIRLYPSLCLFEGTDISVGRGTDFPFQVIGYPDPVFGDFTFIPGSRTGMSAHVEQQGKKCYGVDLRNIDPRDFTFTLQYFVDFYQKSTFKDNFISRPDFFDKLAGNDSLRNKIREGWSAQAIEASWQDELSDYKKMRKKYLLYEDFE